MTPTKGKPLLEHYVKRYEEVEGERPIINRNKKVWGFADMHEDLGKEGSLAVIDYFIDNYENGFHDVDRLLHNYDDLYREMLIQVKEQERRIRIAQETAERVKNFGK